MINKTIYNNRANESIMMKFQTKNNSLIDSFENLSPFLTNDPSQEILNQAEKPYSNTKKKSRLDFVSQVSIEIYDTHIS